MNGSSKSRTSYIRHWAYVSSPPIANNTPWFPWLSNIYIMRKIYTSAIAISCYGCNVSPLRTKCWLSESSHGHVRGTKSFKKCDSVVEYYEKRDYEEVALCNVIRRGVVAQLSSAPAPNKPNESASRSVPVPRHPALCRLALYMQLQGIVWSDKYVNVNAKHRLTWYCKY